MGLQTASSIIGGMSNRNAMSNFINGLKNERNKVQAESDKEVYKDVNQDNGFVAAQEASANLNRQSMRQLAATGAVAGGITPEAMAVQRQIDMENANKMLTDAGLRLDQEKKATKEKYRQEIKSLNEQINDAERQKALATAQAMQGVSKAAGGLMSV